MRKPITRHKVSDAMFLYFVYTGMNLTAACIFQIINRKQMTEPSKDAK